MYWQALTYASKDQSKIGFCSILHQSSVLSFELSNCGQLLIGSILSSSLCWYKCSNLYTCKFSTCGESLFMARNKTLLSFKTPMLCGQVKSADCNSNCQKHLPTMAGMFNDQSTFMYRPIFLRVVVPKAK